MNRERGRNPEYIYFSEFYTGKVLYSVLMVSEALELLDYGDYEIKASPDYKSKDLPTDDKELIPVIISTPKGGADYLFETVSAISNSFDFDEKSEEAQMDFIFERIAKVNEDRSIPVPVGIR